MSEHYMQTLNLLNEAIGTIEDAELIINEFHWFLSIDEMAGHWTIRSGDKTVFTADSREAVDAFLYGMALAYKGLPAHLYAKLFSMMAVMDIPETVNPIDIELTEHDDERLSDLDVTELPNIEAESDDAVFLD